MKNVQNYVEENILNDGANPQSDDGWAFWVDVLYPFWLFPEKGGTQSRVETSRSAAYQARRWSTFIRLMLLWAATRVSFMRVFVRLRRRRERLDGRVDRRRPRK